MPVYEYKCPKCGKVYESNEAIKPPDCVFCFDCDAGMIRQYSFSGTIFKGSGWAKNDK